MSNQETQQLINNELTERINDAYYADDCYLFDWQGTAHLVIHGSRDDQDSVDIIVPYKDLRSMVEKMLPDAQEIDKSEKDKFQDENW